eukprot:GHVH01011567.1.p1 GENE.GHVH01011567.1~~GHVH01011567.1.p1  ORF type:complete len:528 (-),score=54.63 GHVH01011567.1:1905-3422(-)
MPNDEYLRTLPVPHADNPLNVPRNIYLEDDCIWKALKDAGGVGMLGTPISSEGLLNLGKYLNPGTGAKMDAVKLVKFVSDTIGRSPLPVKRFFLGGDYGDRTAIGSYRNLKILVYLKDVYPPYGNTVNTPPDESHNSHSVIRLIRGVLENNYELWNQFASHSFPSISAPARSAYVSSCEFKEHHDWVELLSERLSIQVIPVPWIESCEEPRSTLAGGSHIVQRQVPLVLGYLALHGCEVDRTVIKVWRHTVEELRCILFQSLPSTVKDYIRSVKYMVAVVGQDLSMVDHWLATAALLSVIPADKKWDGFQSLPDNFDALDCLKIFLLSLEPKATASLEKKISLLSDATFSHEDGAVDLRIISDHRIPGRSHSPLFDLGEDLPHIVRQEVYYRAVELLRRIETAPKHPMQRQLQRISMPLSSHRGDNSWLSFIIKGAVIVVLCILGLLKLYTPEKFYVVRVLALSYGLQFLVWFASRCVVLYEAVSVASSMVLAKAHQYVESVRAN